MQTVVIDLLSLLQKYSVSVAGASLIGAMPDNRCEYEVVVLDVCYVLGKGKRFQAILRSSAFFCDRRK